jgi:hypothetical protein
MSHLTAAMAEKLTCPTLPLLWTSSLHVQLYRWYGLVFYMSHLTAAMDE